MKTKKKIKTKKPKYDCGGEEGCRIYILPTFTTIKKAA